MNSPRLVFLLVVATAGLAAAGLLLLGGQRPTNPTEPPAAAAPALTDAVEVVVANASTKQRWLAAVAAQFNAGDRRTRSGKPIRIVVKPVLSGGSLQDILDGKLKPAAWSPGALSWVEDLDEQWRQRTGSVLESTACRPTILTPLGIAMWRPMAEALGWPARPVPLR